jgi:hypothetical protein
LINWASIARPAFEAAFCTNLGDMRAFSDTRRFLDDGNAVVGVDDAVIVGEAEGDGTGVERVGEAEATASDGDRGAEINLDSVVELVGVDAVNLGDVEVAVGGEPVGDSI